MEMLFTERYRLFSYKELQKEIQLNGGNVFYTDKEIKEGVKGKKGYHVIGRVHESITKELFDLEDNPYIYVITCNMEKPVFCSINGFAVYYC